MKCAGYRGQERERERRARIVLYDCGTNRDQVQRELYSDRYKPHSGRIASANWHADITFEHVPSDYAALKIVRVPEDGTGGDTLWAYVFLFTRLGIYILTYIL